MQRGDSVLCDVLMPLKLQIWVLKTFLSFFPCMALEAGHGLRRKRLEMSKAESLSVWEAQRVGKWGNWQHSPKERKPGRWWLEQNWRQNPGSLTGETGFQSRVSASACQGMCPQGWECPHSSEDKQPQEAGPGGCVCGTQVIH